MTDTINITSPVGRIVQGDLYKPRDKNFDGKPLVVMSGPKAGQPRVDYFFALAIPKTPGKPHWGHEDWGAKIWATGHGAFPVAAQRPDFAWKIEDGDSTVPNKRGRRPCDMEGYPGCWVLKFSGGFAPRTYNSNGSAPLDPGAIKTGYYAQVNFNVTGNGNQNNPGIYLNHSLVALAGYGAEIIAGPDPAAVGFGNAALPPGASATPLAGLATASPAAPAQAVAPALAAAPGPVLPAVPVPVAVQPHTAILGTPPLAGAPAAPPPPGAAPAVPAAPVRVMTAKAGGIPYESYIAQAWTDALLIQHGMMLP